MKLLPGILRHRSHLRRDSSSAIGLHFKGCYLRFASFWKSP
jgi:hypothetical protein